MKFVDFWRKYVLQRMFPSMDYAIWILDILTSTSVSFAMFHVYSMPNRSPKEQTIAYGWSSWCMGSLMTTNTLVWLFNFITFLLVNLLNCILYVWYTAVCIKFVFGFWCALVRPMSIIWLYYLSIYISALCLFLTLQL